MQSFMFFLLPVVAIYTVTTLAAWLIAVTRIHGIVWSPGASFRIFKPVIIAFLAGFFPAAILSAVLIPRLPDAPWVAFLVFAAGMVVTGALVHRALLKTVSTARPWNTAIAALTLIGLIAFGWLSWNMIG